MRFISQAIVVAALLAVAGIAVSQTKQTKPKTKPKTTQKAPAKPATKGTAQLPGDNGQLNVTYTMGKGTEAINWTLLSAEYTVLPFRTDQNLISGSAEHKLLVLRGTLHNPNKDMLQVSHSSLNFTVVHADDQNYEPRAVIHGHNLNTLSMELKPAQKVEIITIIQVPAKGEAPKLMIAHWNDTGKVLRYDLRGKVKALPDPYKDPSVKTGADARDMIPATMGTPYHMGVWQINIEKIEYMTTALDPDVSEEEQFAVVTGTVKNATPVKQDISHSWIEGMGSAADGGKADGRVIMAGRNEALESTEVAPGESIRFRIVFTIPRSTKLEKFTVMSFDSESKPSAKFVYEMK